MYGYENKLLQDYLTLKTICELVEWLQFTAGKVSWRRASRNLTFLLGKPLGRFSERHWSCWGSTRDSISDKRVAGSETSEQKDIIQP